MLEMRRGGWRRRRTSGVDVEAGGVEAGGVEAGGVEAGGVEAGGVVGGVERLEVGRSDGRISRCGMPRWSVPFSKPPLRTKRGVVCGTSRQHPEVGAKSSNVALRTIGVANRMKENVSATASLGSMLGYRPRTRGDGRGPRWHSPPEPPCRCSTRKSGHPQTRRAT